MFVLAFNNINATIPNNPINNTANKVERNSHRKNFLPRINITNYIVLIDGRNFYDQPINDMIKQYDEIRKIATGQGDHHTIGWLFDYQYFKDHYSLIAIDLSKQKELRCWFKTNSTNWVLWGAKNWLARTYSFKKIERNNLIIF